MCRTVLHSHLSLVNSILHEEIPDMYVSGISCTRISPIFLHTNCTFIVLIENIVFNCISFCTHEHYKPYIVWDIFAHSYQLILCRTFHVYLLFSSFSVHYSVTHRYGTPCMSSHIIMFSIGRIYPRVQVSQRFCTNNYFVLYCIFHKHETSF